MIEFNSKLVPGTANCFYLVFRRAAFGEFPSQTAYVHIQASVKWMEFSTKHFF